MRKIEVTSRGRNETGPHPLAGSARRWRFLLSALQDRPEGPLLERACLSFLGAVFCFVVVTFSFDCHAPVCPFAFLSRSKGHLPRFASPAGGHFLLRQKVTKERPGTLSLDPTRGFPLDLPKDGANAPYPLIPAGLFVFPAGGRTPPAFGLRGRRRAAGGVGWDSLLVCGYVLLWGGRQTIIGPILTITLLLETTA